MMIGIWLDRSQNGGCCLCQSVGYDDQSKGALAKLDRTARHRCAVTMVANSSPRYDPHLMNAIGALGYLQ